MKDLVLTTCIPNRPMQDSPTHTCPWCKRAYYHRGQFEMPEMIVYDAWKRRFGEQAAAHTCNRCLEECDG